jgi:ABC-2 type transport system ATP-binding protein
MILEVRHLDKSFGANRVLRDVSFTASPGAAVGLLGRNGAGKTTTIRIIMQVFPPDAGQVLLDGQPLEQSGASLGYMPEEKGLYPKIKICDQLIYFGRLRGLNRQSAVRAVRHWLERFELSDAYDRKLETLSKGNQQKIQLALALLADPDIVILDEPFSGLDPVNAQLLKTIVQEQVDAGKLVLFSSHQLGTVEQFCDHIALLHQGEILLEGSIRAIKRSYARNRILISLGQDPVQTEARLEQLLADNPAVRSLIRNLQPAPDGCLVELHRPDDRAALYHALADLSQDLEQFRIVEPSLEDIFVGKVGDRS